jgi:tRNA threonylcarbamoyladenosine biosynthesis protein TsaB
MAYTGNDLEGLLGGPVILAMETATMCGSIAIVAEGQCLAEFSLQTKETHSRRLLAGVDWIFGEASLDWPDIDAIAVSMGPGSFTGLRIALSTAKGLALASGKKMLGVGTLDGLAAQMFGARQLICPVLDARKNEIYCGLYRCNEQGIPQRQGDYLVLKPEELCERIKEPVILLGDGTTTYGDVFVEHLGNLVTMAPMGSYFPRASTIGLLAVDKWRSKEFLDPAAAEPIYIRPSEAELLYGK